MSELENPEIKLLKSCLNREIEEIFVTEYSEIREDYNYFSSMSFYYIKFADFFLRISSDSNIGVLKFHTQKKIQCNFEIDEEDIFTISTVNKEDYSGQKVVAYDVFFGNDDNHIYGIGIQFEDNKYVHKDNKYIFFSCLSFDEIIFGNEDIRDNYLADSRFRLTKFESESKIS
jgi:hypothetical protein